MKSTLEYLRQPVSPLDILLRFVSVVFGLGFLLSHVWYSDKAPDVMGFAAVIALLLDGVFPWKMIRKVRLFVLLLGIAWGIDIVVQRIPEMQSGRWSSGDLLLYALPLLLHCRVIALCYFQNEQKEEGTKTGSAKAGSV